MVQCYSYIVICLHMFTGCPEDGMRRTTSNKRASEPQESIFCKRQQICKIAVDSVKKIITTSVDKSKLDTLFQKNLDETKEELKKINS